MASKRIDGVFLCEAHDSYLWLELWEITEMKAGCVYKTKPTGKVVQVQDVKEHNFNHKMYTTAPLNMKPGEVRALTYHGYPCV